MNINLKINHMKTNGQFVNQRTAVLPMVRPNGNGGKAIEPTSIQVTPDFVEPENGNFLSVLSQIPDERQVRTNKFANNSEYLSISYIEGLLDAIFQGKWNLRHKGMQFILNSVVCDVELEVWYPDGTLIVRAGSGSCQVQVDAQTGEFKPKSIEKAYAASLSMAFKNAAKRLGNIFGRMLNREDEVHQYYKEAYGNNSKIVNQ
jgi:hypothetical protein